MRLLIGSLVTDSATRVTARCTQDHARPAASTTPSRPHVTIDTARPPRRRIAADEPAISGPRPEHPSGRAACPPGCSSGRHHLTSRSSGATARAVTHAAPPIMSSTAGPRPGREPPAPRRARSSSRDHLVQEVDPPQQRLHQIDAQVRPAASPAPARAARRRCPRRRPGADRKQFGEHRAVEQVPIPQPGHLARTEQAAVDAVGGQQMRVSAARAAAARRTTARAASAASR